MAARDLLHGIPQRARPASWASSLLVDLATLTLKVKAMCSQRQDSMFHGLKRAICKSLKTARVGYGPRNGIGAFRRLNEWWGERSEPRNVYCVIPKSSLNQLIHGTELDHLPMPGEKKSSQKKSKRCIEVLPTWYLLLIIGMRTYSRCYIQLMLSSSALHLVSPCFEFGEGKFENKKPSEVQVL